MPTYSSVVATTPTYTKVTHGGNRIYDDANVTYDDANTFYDSQNPNQYSSVATINPTYSSVASAA